MEAEENKVIFLICQALCPGKEKLPVRQGENESDCYAVEMMMTESKRNKRLDQLSCMKWVLSGTYRGK